ncbi:hypothetical protein HYPSUDRAFT_199916 [Hypholoma sublateritium FD-334 SS-4]|uniref:Uncharacterized protein n=1 Tax=Hypholoma sublateritium (strain FD-334 SS-4) TaxID=945553 RepID=A0A0D2P397_HYPSF|nr:hypothetical protein HYPSUDRAFT_199916 [Hypholoma sublateritium FD-334 SS-4]
MADLHDDSIEYAPPRLPGHTRTAFLLGYAPSWLLIFALPPQGEKGTSRRRARWGRTLNWPSRFFWNKNHQPTFLSVFVAAATRPGAGAGGAKTVSTTVIKNPICAALGGDRQYDRRKTTVCVRWSTGCAVVVMWCAAGRQWTGRVGPFGTRTTNRPSLPPRCCCCAHRPSTRRRATVSTTVIAPRRRRHAAHTATPAAETVSTTVVNPVAGGRGNRRATRGGAGSGAHHEPAESFLLEQGPPTDLLCCPAILLLSLAREPAGDRQYDRHHTSSAPTPVQYATKGMSRRRRWRARDRLRDRRYS